MKKQVQKIKENKGFSMIELIIVVAIMAILVGIIGAALIPYMEKSRASKDKVTLDAAYTAYAAIIAETDANGTVDTSDSNTELWEKIGAKNSADLTAKFKSKQFKGQAVVFDAPDANGVYGVHIQGATGYTGVKIDNTGTEYKVNVKGTPGTFVAASGKADK